MPKKKPTGPGVLKCPEAAKTLANCRWKKDRQNKLNKEVDAMEAKAKIYDIKAKAKAKAKEAKDKAAKKKRVKPKKPEQPPKVTKPKSGSDAKRLREVKCTKTSYVIRCIKLSKIFKYTRTGGIAKWCGMDRCIDMADASVARYHFTWVIPHFRSRMAT